MATGVSSGIAVKKSSVTPKAVIFQKFGKEAVYTVEEVQDFAQNGCPGLAIPQKGPYLYRCRLQLPDFAVSSGIFKKKKDAEQSAAEKAMEKLGIHPSTNNPSAEEASEQLITCVKHLFSNEPLQFLSALHPLSGHFRAALRRDGDLYGSVPASVIAAYDSKLINLCKLINPKVESNQFLLISHIMSAAARLPEFVVTYEGQLSIWRRNSYSPNIVDESIFQDSDTVDNICLKAIHIPSSVGKQVQPVTINISSTGYYLDVIARNLGLADGNKVMISRTIGRASSEMRLYVAAPKSYLMDQSSDFVNVKEVHFEGLLNSRASCLCGQDIYGDAILASIGYLWKSKYLFHEDITLQSYYRMLVNLVPGGVYKLSREAILVADLPVVFTTRTNWRGSFPREILCTFCRLHWWSEPVFSVSSIPLKASAEPSRSEKKLTVSESAEQDKECTSGGGTATNKVESVGSGSAFKCEVKLFSKSHDLILECSPKEFYKKQSDAVQNACLKVLTWLNQCLKEPDLYLEKRNYSASAPDICFYPENLSKKFTLYLSMRNIQQSENQGGKFLKSYTNMQNTMPEHGVYSLRTGGPDSGVYPSNGCLLFISYSVSLVTEGGNTKELLESQEEFEFEIGSGAIIPYVEAVVTQMSIGQSACFNTELPLQELILSAADDSVRILSLLSSQVCWLEYSISLLRVTEPPEDRMEQAFFSPPLSKQRVEYAVQHIRQSSATTLVDFGCGSGSLLDSLLDYPTSLEKVVGVDISQKSLSRAAKILHSKLSTKSDIAPYYGVKSAVLYDGSITMLDSRLCGFDIGTCLEVIEHMDEDEACSFGNIVLSFFRPRILIVSTPNYEYNVILQGSSQTSPEDDPDEKIQSQSCKFRNHDHKFEWTREQFNSWASELAARHNYSVKFSGVGGSADIEPGFASQIAVFRNRLPPEEDNNPKDEDLAHHYNVVWEWDISNQSRSSL